MGFREKWAWVMMLSLVLAGAIYFIPMSYVLGNVGFVVPASAALGTLAIIALIIIATLGAIIMALSNIRDANSPLDEREDRIIKTSQNTGNTILGLGVITIVTLAHMSRDSQWVVPALIAVLVASHLVTYFSQIALFRRDR